jgi:outer membrane protein assembly factor BamD (BamD/ComL family)
MTILKSILFILLFIPGVIIAQDTEEDTTLVTDSLTAEYDSIISKAATSLSRQEFDQAKEYFKEASLLMPGEFYPRKMMIAVESSKQVFLKRQQRTRL